MKAIRPPEVERDADPSAFTNSLRKLWSDVTDVLVVAFVDMEGECIDYVSSLDSYEAKVTAAHMLVIVSTLMASMEKFGLGELSTVELVSDNRELWARRISDEYVLVVMTFSGVDRDQLKKGMIMTVREFRSEAGIETPIWEPPADIMEVETRDAVSWQYAPTSYSDDGEKIAITDVLGRWIENDEIAAHERICFRVRTERGEELTLVHDPDTGQWLTRD